MLRDDITRPFVLLQQLMMMRLRWRQKIGAESGDPLGSYGVCRCRR